MSDKILIIKLGALGDMVLASAAFSAVRRRFPQSKLFLLTTPPYFPIIKGCPYFQAYFFFEREKAFLTQAGKISNALRKEKFRLVVNLQNNFKSNLVARLSGAPERVGFRKGFWPFLLTGSVPYERCKNALWNLNRVLALADVPAAEKPELYLTAQAENEAAQLLKSRGWKGEPLIGLHPGSSAGWQSKRWPHAHWVRLAGEIAGRGFLPVFLGDRHESEELKKITGEIKEKTLNLAGQTDLSFLPAIIKKCRAFVSTDSGPLFLAAAAGIRSIGLYGPTESGRHAPPGVIVLEKKNPACRPCYKKSCPQPLCMNDITVEEVLSVLW